MGRAARRGAAACTRSTRARAAEGPARSRADGARARTPVAGGGIHSGAGGGIHSGAGGGIHSGAGGGIHSGAGGGIHSGAGGGIHSGAGARAPVRRCFRRDARRGAPRLRWKFSRTEFRIRCLPLVSFLRAGDGASRSALRRRATAGDRGQPRSRDRSHRGVLGRRALLSPGARLHR
ncbi:MAG: hypothetical protein CL938_02555 [Deltaproteobacteria bacterium]|nr:hypothetical protein [Deltaproteobacteria bacterium]